MANNKTVSIRTLLGWHRYVGLGVCLLAIHLAITGILLNHTESFKLDNTYISNSTLLKWYGIHLPEKINGYRIDNNWLTRWNDKIYFNDTYVAQSHQKLIGTAKTEYFYALATTEEIWLLTIDGQIIEKLNSPGEKLGDISALASQNNRVVIKTEQGIFIADTDLVSWAPYKRNNITWSATDTIPTPLMQRLFQQGHSINWERFLLDLHSGRIATRTGTFVIDLAGIAMIFLSLTGFTLWIKRRKRKSA